MEQISTEYPSTTIAAITQFLFIGSEKKDLKPSDLVIVLGNEFIDGTVCELNDMVLKGIIREDATIILSGATGSLNAGEDLECNRLFECATKKYHMPAHLFAKECKATNAYLNFLNSKELLQKRGGFEKYSSILCIGKAFLLRRASMYASKLGYPIEKMQYYGTVDREGKNIGADSWWKSDEAINRVMAEVERIGRYYAKGDLGIF